MCDDTCSICMELLSNDDKELEIVPLCRHSFHKECLDPWKERSNFCPLCRGVIDETKCIDVDPLTSELISRLTEEIQSLRESVSADDYDWDSSEGVAIRVSMNENRRVLGLLVVLANPNRIPDIEPLSGLVNLDALDLRGNQFPDV